MMLTAPVSSRALPPFSFAIESQLANVPELSPTFVSCVQPNFFPAQADD